MTPSEIAKLRAVVHGFRGRFFFDAERGDLAFIAEECEAQQCECERKTNSDGDQDCSLSVGDMDADIDDVGEPIAEMLNALPVLLDEVERLAAAHERVRDELMAANLDVSTDDAPETFAHHVFVLRMAMEARGENMDELAKDRDRLRALLGEALTIAERHIFIPHVDERVDYTRARVVAVYSGAVHRDHIRLAAIREEMK